MHLTCREASNDDRGADYVYDITGPFNLTGRVALVRLLGGVVEARRRGELRARLLEVGVPPFGIHLLHAHAINLEGVPRAAVGHKINELQ